MAKKTENGIAEYLDQYIASPYSYPENNRQSVDRVSTLKGSWVKQSNS